jgi:uncharacterized protein YdeI (YjbR/CyaY-like superfamily)
VLTKAGLITPAGQKAFDLRKESKSKIYSYEKEPVLLNAAYEKQFKKNKAAWEFFSKQAPSYKKVMIHWIMAAKKEETREARLAKAIAVSEQEKKMLW